MLANATAPLFAPSPVARARASACLPLADLRLRPGHDAVRGHLVAGRHLGPRFEHAVGAHPRAVPDRRPGAHGLAHHRALPDRGVGQHGVGPDLGPRPDPARAPQDHPRQQGDVRFQSGLGVHVRALGVPHGHAPAHPALVDAVAQLGLRDGQLGPVVDPGRLHGVGQHEGADRCNRRCCSTPIGVGQVVLRPRRWPG